MSFGSRERTRKEREEREGGERKLTFTTRLLAFLPWIQLRSKSKGQLERDMKDKIRKGENVLEPHNLSEGSEGRKRRKRGQLELDRNETGREATCELTLNCIDL